MTERRALVIGEALVDVVVHPDGSREEHPGGSPANVALGLARLGRQVDLLTWLAHDAYGRRVRSHLESSGVRVLAGNRSALATPVAVARIDEHGAANYEFELEWDLPTSWDGDDEKPLVVHTGSIATTLQPGGTAVAKLVQAHRATSTITYDPNLRPAIMGTPARVASIVDGLVRAADVVKVSSDDLAWLAPNRSPDDIAAQWSRVGPAIVVVTHGGEGAFAATSSGVRLHLDSAPVTVVDTVGAGDSFMSGLIDGLWSADLLGGARRADLRQVDATTLESVLARCVRIAGITVSRAGANPPRSAELGEEHP
jgi:fructokinase